MARPSLTMEDGNLPSQTFGDIQVQMSNIVQCFGSFIMVDQSFILALV